ncbi:MAG TPA: BON domain-containing protein [Terriglobales bacterium]|jgi:hypothetical protein|nr:BON domain-containing protein [Terriglobales bacterium]
MNASSDVQSKIQTALQANPSLSGISVSSSAKGIELTGTANSAKDRKEALRIAKENANGMKVKDSIKVGASAKSDAKN